MYLSLSSSSKKMTFCTLPDVERPRRRIIFMLSRMTRSLTFQRVCALEELVAEDGTDVDRLLHDTLVKQNLGRVAPGFLGHPPEAVGFRVGTEERAPYVSFNLLHQHVLLRSVFRIGLDDDVGGFLRAFDDVSKGLHVGFHETLHEVALLGDHLLCGE